MTTSTSEAPKTSEGHADAIRGAALQLGFDACGFASVDAPWPAGTHLAEFVAAGRHGTMYWMARTAARRAHPKAMWPDARSAIVLGLNYGPDHDPLAALQARSHATIS